MSQKREAEFGFNEDVYRNNNGIIQSIDLSYDNFSGVKTEWIDFEIAHTVFDNSTGRWDYFLNATKIFDKYNMPYLELDSHPS